VLTPDDSNLNEKLEEAPVLAFDDDEIVSDFVNEHRW
jgi:hypothetical protein